MRYISILQAMWNDEALLVLVKQKLFLQIKLISVQADILKRKMVENEIYGLTTVLFNIDVKY